MTMNLQAHILTPQGFVRGRLLLEGQRIAAVEGQAVSEDEARASTTLPLLLPGFVDLHLHGGGGAHCAHRFVRCR